MLAHLIALYGEPKARRLFPRVLELIEKYRPTLQISPGEVDPSQNKAVSTGERAMILVVHPDQILEDRKAPLRSLGTFLNAHLRGLFSAIHLLPFLCHASDDGYSVTDFTRVDPDFGNWNQIANIGRNFDLMFDAVFNHVSFQHPWFERFLEGDPDYQAYFHAIRPGTNLDKVARPRALPLLTRVEGSGGPRLVWTTFGSHQPDLNLACPDVFLELLEVVLEYVSHGAIFLRLVDLPYWWKEPGSSCFQLPQTHVILKFLRCFLDETAPSVMLVAEAGSSMKDNLAYFGDQEDEAQFVYDSALPGMVLHAIQTGNCTRLVKYLDRLEPPHAGVGFIHQLAGHAGIPLDPLTGLLPAKEISQLIDRTLEHGGYLSERHARGGIANQPYELNLGYFDALSDPRDRREPVEVKINRFLAAQAVMFSLPGVPALYFHSLFGSRSDWDGAETSGIPRRVHREKLRLLDLERDLLNPDTLRFRVFRRMREMLQHRRGNPAFHPLGAHTHLKAGSAVMAIHRKATRGTNQVLCLHNLSGKPVRAVLNSPLLTRKWEDLFTLETFAGEGRGHLEIPLRPYQVIWARAKGGNR